MFSKVFSKTFFLKKDVFEVFLLKYVLSKYIYIYIYMCVCVCVCVFFMNPYTTLKNVFKKKKFFSKIITVTL